MSERIKDRMQDWRGAYEEAGVKMTKNFAVNKKASRFMISLRRMAHADELYSKKETWLRLGHCHLPRRLLSLLITAFSLVRRHPWRSVGRIRASPPISEDNPYHHRRMHELLDSGFGEECEASKLDVP
jgi:hypothetical protein